MADAPERQSVKRTNASQESHGNRTIQQPALHEKDSKDQSKVPSTLAETVFTPANIERFKSLTDVMTRSKIIAILSSSIKDPMMIAAIFAFYTGFRPHKGRDCSKERKAVDAAYATLQQAQAALDQAKADLDEAEKDLKSADAKLAASDARDHDAYSDVVSLASQRVNAAAELVGIREAAVQSAQDNYARAVDALCNCMGTGVSAI